MGTLKTLNYNDVERDAMNEYFTGNYSAIQDCVQNRTTLCTKNKCNFIKKTAILLQSLYLNQSQRTIGPITVYRSQTNAMQLIDEYNVISFTNGWNKRFISTVKEHEFAGAFSNKYIYRIQIAKGTPYIERKSKQLDQSSERKVFTEWLLPPGYLYINDRNENDEKDPNSIYINCEYLQHAAVTETNNKINIEYALTKANQEIIKAHLNPPSLNNADMQKMQKMQKMREKEEELRAVFLQMALEDDTINFSDCDDDINESRDVKRGGCGKRLKVKKTNQQQPNQLITYHKRQFILRHDKITKERYIICDTKRTLLSNIRGKYRFI
jgi:hypothetical protein